VVETAPLSNVATKTAVKAKPPAHATTVKPAASAALVESTEVKSTEPAASDSAPPPNTPIAEKPRNPVVKALRRINPFQQKSSAPRKDDPAN
jgi:hypothetical protein